MAINSAVLMGRLTAEPELKTTTNGKFVLSFTLAVDRPFSKDTTDFINCVAWSQTADFISKYFSKGDMMGITGSIQTRKYETNQGEKRTATEILVSNVSFCGGKPKNEPQNALPDVIDEGDLPF